MVFRLIWFESGHNIPIDGCPLVELPIFRGHKLEVRFGNPQRIPDLCHRLGDVSTTLGVSLSVISDGECEEETSDFVLRRSNLRYGGGCVSEGAGTAV